MELEGIVRNVTDFGAFVDVGLHNDGLIHKSQMADGYVANPIDVLSVGEKIKVKVLAIDEEREKLSLSSKEYLKAPERAKKNFERREKKPERPERRSSENSGMKGNIVWG